MAISELSFVQSFLFGSLICVCVYLAQEDEDDDEDEEEDAEDAGAWNSKVVSEVVPVGKAKDMEKLPVMRINQIDKSKLVILEDDEEDDDDEEEDEESSAPIEEQEE